MLTFLCLLVAFFMLPGGAHAHISLWHSSMFGRCGSKNQCTNTAEPVIPLQDLPFRKWWWHGYLKFPPANDSVMALPAGKRVTVQLAGNVAFTNLGQFPNVYWPGGGRKKDRDPRVENNVPYWSSAQSGNLHTAGHSDLAGCALSIAYTSDARAVRPEDMTVFSVQHECVWQRDTVFEIPAKMPPCPRGKCMCSWWWIHNSDGGSDQIYQTAFQCNVTYETGQTVGKSPVRRPVPPVNCENDRSKCVRGPKMPMYWKQKECNNMPEPGHRAPTYNARYGFANGAQNDIFQAPVGGKTGWTCPQSTAKGVFGNGAMRMTEERSLQV